MKLSSLVPDELARRLREEGLCLRTGPLRIKLHSPLADVAMGLHRLYGDYVLEPDAGFYDFHVRVEPVPGTRRWLRPQVRFMFDGRAPFRPLPRQQAFPMLEWGLNWCVANHMHQYLILHAAVVAKDGRAAILPGPPGAGKSTLCAALVSRGWRLLSDELTILSLDDGTLVPMPRPVNLKNDSIDLIRHFAPGAIFGPICEDTRKGTVAHMKPPTTSVIRAQEPVYPGWVVLPGYKAGAESELLPESKARMFMHLAQNAFNYHILGSRGFRVLETLIDASHCFRYTYHRLDDALQAFSQLTPPARTTRPELQLV